MNVIVDAMGGDNAPHAIVEGCILGLRQNKALNIILVGRQELIDAELKKHKYNKQRIEVVNATEVIGMAEAPVDALRNKKDSSVVVGLRLLKEGRGGVFISAGSTGAVIAGATLIVRRMKKVKRPGLAAVLPTKKGGVLLMDCGASVECRASFLAQFALMGSIYMEQVGGVKNPRVGLVNNGAEAEKGSDLTKEAYKQIEKTPVNFAGNAEGRDFFSGDFDVLVTDGFTGNIVLKNTEGLASFLMYTLKKELKNSLRNKIGAKLAMPAFQGFKKSLDYTEYGGGLLLGINGGVIKAHGSSNAKAIGSTLRQASEFISGDVVGKIREKISKISLDD